MSSVDDRLASPNGAASHVATGQRGQGRSRPGPFREYLATSRRAEDHDGADYYGGPGVTLDAVIAAEREAIDAAVAADSGLAEEAPGDMRERMSDVVVWERGRVAAIVRPRRDGVQAVKFAPRSGAAVIDTPPRTPALGPGPDRRLREYLVTCRDIPSPCEDRKTGFGLGLDAVIGDLVDIADHCVAASYPKHSPTVDAAIEPLNDWAIWGPDPSRLAAVVLPRPGGVRVIRLDSQSLDAPTPGGAKASPAVGSPPAAPPGWASDPEAFALAMESTRGLAREFLEAREITARYDLDHGNPAVDVFASRNSRRFNDAATNLLAAVLAWGGSTRDDPERRALPDSAIKLGDHLFVAVHEAEEDLREDGEKGGNSADHVMQLAAIPLSRVIDLDALAAREEKLCLLGHSAPADRAPACPVGQTDDPDEELTVEGMSPIGDAIPATRPPVDPGGFHRRACPGPRRGRRRGDGHP